MTTVCAECLIQNHRECHGLIEVGEQPEFCECAVCVQRFERNLRRILVEHRPSAPEGSTEVKDG